MKKTLLLLLLHLFLTCSLIAQQEFRSKSAFHIAYMGEMVTHPGLSIGYEKYLNESEKFQIFLRPVMGFYHHYRNNTTFHLNLESGFRRTFKSGFFLEQSMGIGYFHRFVDGDGNYYIDENGNVASGGNVGIPFVPFLANVGIGYHIHTSKINISPFLRPNTYWKLPLNSTPNMQFALLAGIIFRIK